MNPFDLTGKVAIATDALFIRASKPIAELAVLGTIHQRREIVEAA